MQWSHNDVWMVTGDHAGYIKYWQSNMNNVKMFQAHKEPIRRVSFSPTDAKFASCSDDGTVSIKSPIVRIVLNSPSRFVSGISSGATRRKYCGATGRT